MAAKKLLVADDSLTIQKVIRLALSNEGYEIQAVADGNDALNQILLFQPDVVLIDVSLPGKNAFEVKSELNEHGDLEAIRFVLISSAFEQVDEQEVERVHFHHRLTKPFDPEHLREVLRSVLAQAPPAHASRKPSPALPPELPPGGDSTASDVLMAAPPPFLSGPDPLPHPPEHSQPDLLPGMDLAEPSLELDLPPMLPTDEPTPSLAHAPSLPPTSLATPSMTTPPMVDHLQLGAGDFGGEADIKRLTESTMRISGMDDYQWSLNEPSLRPLPLMDDRSGSQFQFNSAPIPPPPPPLRASLPPTPAAAQRILPASSGMEDRSYAPLLDEAPPAPRALPHFDGDPLLEEAAISSPILASEEKIDAMIHSQIETTLQRMIEKVLPELAEKLIKAEIHRMLSE